MRAKLGGWEGRVSVSWVILSGILVAALGACLLLAGRLRKAAGVLIALGVLVAAGTFALVALAMLRGM